MDFVLVKTMDDAPRPPICFGDCDSELELVSFWERLHMKNSFLVVLVRADEMAQPEDGEDGKPSAGEEFHHDRLLMSSSTSSLGRQLACFHSSTLFRIACSRTCWISSSRFLFCKRSESLLYIVLTLRTVRAVPFKNSSGVIVFIIISILFVGCFVYVDRTKIQRSHSTLGFNSSLN